MGHSLDMKKSSEKKERVIRYAAYPEEYLNTFLLSDSSFASRQASARSASANKAPWISPTSGKLRYCAYKRVSGLLVHCVHESLTTRSADLGSSVQGSSCEMEARACAPSFRIAGSQCRSVTEIMWLINAGRYSACLQSLLVSTNLFEMGLQLTRQRHGQLPKMNGALSRRRRNLSSEEHRSHEEISSGLWLTADQNNIKSPNRSPNIFLKCCTRSSPNVNFSIEEGDSNKIL